MEPWLKISLLLSLFGFIREIRPSEPFIAKFLVNWHNVTIDEVLRDVFPVGTYAYLAQSIVAFLITDFLRYKPLIFVAGFSGVVVWALLLWTSSIFYLQLLEVFYGTYLATEVAYFTYIYAKVDREHFDRVTAHTRAAQFWGRFIGSSMAQILYNFQWMDLRQLNYITFVTQIICTVLSLFLPSVKTSIYFHRKPIEPTTPTPVELEAMVDAEAPKPQVTGISSAFSLLWSQLISSYSNRKVLQWSLWYALGTCGFLQVTSYIQVLWDEIDNTQEIIWNGATEAAVTLFSAIVSTFAEQIHAKFLSKRGSLFSLTILSFLAGGSIILGTNTNSLYASYVGYTLFCTLYAFAITVASAEVAKHLADDTFGLIFGVNTFFALAIQSLLTVVVVSESGLDLNVFQQFNIYAGYYFVLGGVYLAAIVGGWIVAKGKSS